MEQVRVLPVVQLRSRSGRRGLWPGLYPARRHVGQTIILRSAVLWHFPVRLSRRFPSLSHPLSPSSTQAEGQRPPPVCPFRLIALVHGVPARDPAPSWTRAASYSQGPSCSRGTGFSPGRGCDWFPQLSPHCLQYATPIPALYPVENIFPKKEYPRLEIHAIILVISREYPIWQREWILNERVRCYEMSLLLPSGEQGGGLPSRR